MPSAVITRKGQVTIPKAIREEVKIKVGDRVSFVVRDGEIVLRALRGSILDLEGSVKPRQQPEDFSAVRQDVLNQALARGAYHAEVSPLSKPSAKIKASA